MDITKLNTPINLSEYWIIFSESIIGKNINVETYSPTIGKLLIKTYSDKNRHYHNINHIEQCLSELHSIALPKIMDLNEVIFAIIFHDCIYMPKGKFNEYKSAVEAFQALKALRWLSIANSFIDPIKVHDLIMATKHDRDPKTIDEQFIIDIDLSILGKDDVTFGQYEKNIRKEYSWVSDEEFKEGRISILQKFLDRESIYYTAEFQEKYEEQARKNIQSSIEKLRK